MWNAIEQNRLAGDINAHLHSLKAETAPSKSRLLTFILSSIILLYFIFAPGINGAYYAGDDSRYAFGGYRQSCKTDDGFEFMLTLGRPLQAYLDCINYKTAFTLERMSYLRLTAVSLMGCAMGLLAEYLVILGLTFWTAFFVAGSLFLLPRLYGDTVITAATSLPCSLLLVLLSYKCINKAHLFPYFKDKQSRNNKIGWMVLAAILTYCSLLTYPALTFFFGSLIMLKLLFSPMQTWPKVKKEALQETALFMLMCIVYFIWANYNMRYHALAPVPESYRVDHPNFNIIEIVKRIAALGNIFSPIWEILPEGNLRLQGWLSLVVLASGALGAIFSFTRSNFYLRDKKHALINLSQLIIAIIALFILSSSLFLVIPNEDAGGSRQLFGVAAAGLALTAWCLCYCSSFLPHRLRHATIISLTGIFFLTEAVNANTYVQRVASLYEQRTHFITTTISDYLKNNKQVRRVHFVLVRPVYPYSRFFLTNTGLMQTLGRGNYYLKWCSLPRGVTEDEPHHQKEMLSCIANLPKNGIGVTYSYIGEPYVKSSNMLTIENTNELI